MAKRVNPVPKGYRTVTPCLIVSDVNHAVDFYTQALGAELLTQANDLSDSFAVQASVKIGNSVIILQAENLASGLLSPLSQANGSNQLHLYVEDIDALWARALAAGATVISEPVDTYWGDLATVGDWSQAQPLQCGYPATAPSVGDYLTVDDTLPTPAPSHGYYYVTAVNYQGDIRYGRKLSGGVLTGRDPAVLPACK